LGTRDLLDIKNFVLWVISVSAFSTLIPKPSLGMLDKNESPLQSWGFVTSEKTKHDGYLEIALRNSLNP